MIDPITAFSAVSAASGAISSAIKAGRDLSSLGGPIAKYAKAEAELQFGATRKKNSIFSKMTGAEQAGIDEFFRKQRALQKEELEYRAKMRDRIILWTVLPIVLIAGAAAIFYFITFLKSLK
jgi:hypothetical protein